MARTFLILVSDNHEHIESTKKYWEGQEVTVQVYSPTQWREGMNNAFFRQQLVVGVPSLVTGSAPLNHEYTNNVVQFPTAAPSSLNSIQKMDDIEAQAISSAIDAYNGNLTEAAKALGIGRATLYRKVKQYHLDPSQARKKRVAA
ncbi:MAG: helix-turn-helix domain-containing protein [Bdellovibrionia bacterium]